MKSSSLLTGTELRSVVRSSSPDIRSEGPRVSETAPETKTLASARACGTFSRMDEAKLPTMHRKGLRLPLARQKQQVRSASKNARERDNGTYLSLAIKRFVVGEKRRT